MRVQHVITGLDVGGTEIMLCKLLAGMDRGRFEHTVTSLTDLGPVGERIRALGVTVRALGMKRHRPGPAGVLRLARQLRRERVDVVQTWLYHADLVGGLAARLAGVPVVWGLRQSNLGRAVNKVRTLAVARLGAGLSHWLPRRIVCCSHAARAAHVRIGYARERMVVIPNGFEIDRFRPDPQARRSVRAELGLSADARVIGLIARFDPQKDHAGFVRAAGLLHRRAPDVHFLLCGDGIDRSNVALGRWIEQAGVAEQCHLLGRRDDVARLTAALDVATSSSVGEGFPNVIGEAMSCGVPCVVTDVGDSAQIVADTGYVVPPADAQALAAAWENLIARTPAERATLGASARLRIEQHYTLAAVARRYAELYEEVAGGVRHHGVS